MKEVPFLGITFFLTGLDYFCSMSCSVVFKTFPLKGKDYLFVLCCFHPQTADVKPGHDLRESHVSGLFSSTKYLFLPLLHSSFACWTLENNILTHINVRLQYVKSQSRSHVSWYHVHSHNITIHLLKL